MSGCVSWTNAIDLAQRLMDVRRFLPVDKSYTFLHAAKAMVVVDAWERRFGATVTAGNSSREPYSFAFLSHF